MKDNVLRLIATGLLLVYLLMQLLCILPNDNRRQVVFLLWLICAYSAYTPIVSRTLKMKHMLLLYVFLGFMFVSMLYRHSIVYSISASITFCELFSPLLMYRILREENKTTRWVVLIFITVIFVVNFLTCLKFLANSPTGHGLRDAEYITGLKNIFFAVYSFAILVPFIVYCISHNRKHGRRNISLTVAIVGYAICLVLAYLVINAQFMTAIILMIAGALFAFFYDRRGARIVVPLVAVLAIFLFTKFSNELIAVADRNDAVAVSMRLEELQNILSNNAEDAEDYSSRQNRSQSSIETFLENPLIGVFYKYEDINEAKLQGIGNHAEWLDTMARYGLFGLLLIVFIVKAVFKHKELVGASIHFILFIILGFLNPVFGFYLICSVFFYMSLLRAVFFKE